MTATAPRLLRHRPRARKVRHLGSANTPTVASTAATPAVSIQRSIADDPLRGKYKELADSCSSHQKRHEATFHDPHDWPNFRRLLDSRLRRSRIIERPE